MTGTDLIVPVTGELVPADAPREKLGELVAWIDDVARQLRDLKSDASIFLLARLDDQVREGLEESWTQRFDNLEVTATPPGDTEEYDAKALHTALTEECGEQVADRVVKRETSWKPDRRQIARVKKAGGRPAEIIAEHERVVPKPRRVIVKQAA